MGASFDSALVVRVEASPRQIGPWWRQAGVIDVLIDALVEHDLWLGFDHWGVETTARRRPLTTPDAFAASARTRKADLYVLQHGPARFAAGSSLTLDVAEHRMLAVLRLYPAELLPRAARVLADIAAVFAAVARAMGTSWRFASRSGVDLDEVPYPRPRPPIDCPGWLVGALLNAVAREPGEWAPVVTGTALPPGVVHTVVDDLVLVRWTDSLEDPEAVRWARSRQELWTREHLDTVRDPYFNAAGDRRLVVRAEPRAPFAVYDPDRREGFVTVGAWTDGTVDDADLDRLAGLTAAAGPGAAFDVVSAVVQDRAVAVAVRDRLRAAGAVRVAYLSEHGGLWDPFPPGLWRVDP